MCEIVVVRVFLVLWCELYKQCAVVTEGGVWCGADIGSGGAGGGVVRCGVKGVR